MEGKPAAYGRLTYEITSYLQIPITEDKCPCTKGPQKEGMKLQAYNIIQACLVTRSYIVKLGILLLISVTMHKGAQLPQPDPSDVSLQGKNVFLSCQ